MCSIFSKANILRKLASKVKYISQINRGLIMFCFVFNSRIRFFKISWLNCEQNKERIKSRKKFKLGLSPSKKVVLFA